MKERARRNNTVLNRDNDNMIKPKVPINPDSEFKENKFHKPLEPANMS